MKITPVLILCIGLAFLNLVIRAETIIDEKFDEPLSPDRWKAYPGAVKTCEGILTIDANDEVNRKASSGFATSPLRTASGLSCLNFTKNKVDIKLVGLEIKGSAESVNRSFQLFLLSDKSDETATSKVHLRISADGRLSLWLHDLNTPGKTPPLYSAKLTLPVKNLKLTLYEKGMTLSIEDQESHKEEDIRFPTPPTTDWVNSSPFLRLQAQRNPGSGDTQVILRGLSVDSIPTNK